METRYSSNPKDAKHYTTERLRTEYLIQNLFNVDRIKLIYSHDDRIIIGGVIPHSPVTLQGSKELGADFFLARRELGTINIGGKGIVVADGVEFALDHKEGLYIGKDTKEVVFSSVDLENPAKFYLASGPAHMVYPTTKIALDQASKTHLGTSNQANERTLCKYIHPGGVLSSQLVMGMTTLSPGSVWNTMPCHTHNRRMEVYLYLDLTSEDVVFHLMGEPNETRHIVVRNEEAVISPSWSIHSGVATKNYTFIWAMVGENQVFTDMDHVAIEDVR